MLSNLKGISVTTVDSLKSIIDRSLPNYYVGNSSTGPFLIPIPDSANSCVVNLNGISVNGVDT